MTKSEAEILRDMANDLDSIMESDLNECACGCGCSGAGHSENPCKCAADCSCGCNAVNESEELNEGQIDAKLMHSMILNHGATVEDLESWCHDKCVDYASQDEYEISGQRNGGLSGL